MKGFIIGRFYDESLTTGVAQVARGALEAFAPWGRLANAGLDVAATIMGGIREGFGFRERYYVEDHVPFPFSHI